MKVLTARQAWDMLEKEPENQAPETPAPILVDVRTRPEWVHVGLPDASAMMAPLLCLTWQPDRQREFVEALVEAVPDQQTPLLFLCRSGMRSHHAALLAENAGYADVSNIVDGFEDQHGPDKGWRASGLPSTHMPLSGS
ncbi:rhodanese-like domain-containing protein [Gluconobacter roseus]|uniref:rhodanese-like domain-containing protein n=1 Tax=Gluconobacter roseus TaxID=586239 RepID=UPI0038D19AA1